MLKYCERFCKSYQDTDGITWFYHLFIFEDQNKEKWILEGPPYDEINDLIINAKSYEDQIKKGIDPVKAMNEWRTIYSQFH